MIIDFSQIKEKLSSLSGKKVLVGGCFDVFHYGHLDFLKKASALGEILIIALESDEFIKRFKKRTPIHNQQQRAEILDSLKLNPVIIKLPLLNGYDDYLNLVEMVRPNFIAITEGDPQTENKKKQAQKVNAELKIVNKIINPFSSTYIIKLKKDNK